MDIISRDEQRTSSKGKLKGGGKMNAFQRKQKQANEEPVQVWIVIQVKALQILQVSLETNWIRLNAKYSK